MEIKRSLSHGDFGTFEIISDFANLIGPGKKVIWRLHSAWSNPDYLYAYFPDLGRLFRTANARGPASVVRGSWVELPLLPRTDVWLGDIDTDFEDPNVLYLSYGSSSFYSGNPDGTEMVFKVDYNDLNNVITDDLTGSASTWNQPPNTGVGWECLTLERGSDGGMYLATDVGVYFLNEKLKTSGDGWQLIGTNLPHIPSKGIEMSYQANKLRVGMVGRGLWEHSLWCPIEVDEVESGSYTTNEFIEVTNNIESTAKVNASLDVSYRGGNEITLKPGFHAKFGSEFHAFIHPCDAPGNSFKNLPIPSEPISHDEQLVEDSQSLISIYPNPSTGVFNLVIQNGLELHTLNVVDISGREVPVRYSPHHRISRCVLDENTVSGTYQLIAILSNGIVQYGKLILAK